MKKRIVTLILAGLMGTIGMLSLTGCKNYCSYGGCMREAEPGSDRCAEHQGLDNDPYYGVPDEWKN